MPTTYREFIQQTATIDTGIAVRVWAPFATAATVTVAASVTTFIIDGTTSTVDAATTIADTFGEWVDAANAITGVVAHLEGAIRSDGTTAALLARSATSITQGSAPDGVPLYLDTSASEALTNSVVLGLGATTYTPYINRLDSIRQYAGGTDPAGQVADFPGGLNECAWVSALWTGATTTSSTATLEFLSVNDATGVATTVASTTLTAGTRFTRDFVNQEGGVIAAVAGSRLAVRIAAPAGASTTAAASTDLRIKVRSGFPAEETWVNP